MSVENFDMEADVVVIGYGGAGGISAISAHDNGAKVIVLEKQSEGGGSTKMAGGGLFVPTGKGVASYMEKLLYGTVGREMIDVYIEGAMKIPEFVKSSLGGDTEPNTRQPLTYPRPPPKASFPGVKGSEYVSKMQIKGTEGTAAGRLFSLISSNVERRGIQVLYNTPAKELITNQKREVIGVAAEKEGKKIRVKAKKAVILTCGGFEYDETLKGEYLPCKPWYAFGNAGNTGDGIRMAQQVGADLWHMRATSGSAGFKSEEFESAFQVRFFSERFIYVDRDGNRFTDETGVEIHEIATRLPVFDSKRMDFPRVPMYAIIDDVGRRKGPLNSGDIGANFYYNRYKWSPDNSAEIKKGWIAQGKSVKELAAKIQIDPAVLERTVSKYNEYCKTGNDLDFGRSKETMTALEPLYYAIQLWPCLINTQGGPRRNKEARVLDPWGKPIPRLYSAGELGSFWGFLYQGSGNLGECLVFGQIAGRNAAAEKPW